MDRREDQRTSVHIITMLQLRLPTCAHIDLHNHIMAYLVSFSRPKLTLEHLFNRVMQQMTRGLGILTLLTRNTRTYLIRTIFQARSISVPTVLLFFPSRG